MLKNSRILITGAGGFIGLHLAKSLSINSNFIVGLLFLDEENIHLNKSIFCDVTKAESLIKLYDYEFDHIFHLAGFTNIRQGITNPLLDFNINTKGTINLIEIFRKKNIKSFNYVSSVSVLSSSNILPLNENAIYGPTTPYAASKMSSEAFLLAYAKCYNMPIKIIRLFNVYGPNRHGLVVNDFINKLIKNPKQLEILGDGSQIRDFLYVSDAVNGLELIAIKGLKGNIYHLGSGIPLSIMGLAIKIIDNMNLKNVKISTNNINYKGEFIKWYADISKIVDLGFSPKVELNIGLKNTIEWIINNKNK